MSLLTRVGSVAAAAALATSGVLATAGAADATTTHLRRLPTSLSIVKVAHPRHHFAVVSGRLSSHRIPLRDKFVYLARRTPGTSFHIVRRELSHRHGWVAFRVSPGVRSQYVLVFRGSPNFRPSHSGVVTVRARA
jgi:hypothetical protein